MDPLNNPITPLQPADPLEGTPPSMPAPTPPPGFPDASQPINTVGSSLPQHVQQHPGMASSPSQGPMLGPQPSAQGPAQAPLQAPPGAPGLIACSVAPPGSQEAAQCAAAMGKAASALDRFVALTRGGIADNLQEKRAWPADMRRWAEDRWGYPSSAPPVVPLDPRSARALAIDRQIQALPSEGLHGHLGNSPFAHMLEGYVEGPGRRELQEERRQLWEGGPAPVVPPQVPAAQAQLSTAGPPQAQIPPGGWPLAPGNPLYPAPVFTAEPGPEGKGPPATLVSARQMRDQGFIGYPGQGTDQRTSLETGGRPRRPVTPINPANAVAPDEEKLRDEARVVARSAPGSAVRQKQIPETTLQMQPWVPTKERKWNPTQSPTLQPHFNWMPGAMGALGGAALGAGLMRKKPLRGALIGGGLGLGAGLLAQHYLGKQGGIVNNLEEKQVAPGEIPRYAQHYLSKKASAWGPGHACIKWANAHAFMGTPMGAALQQMRALGGPPVPPVMQPRGPGNLNPMMAGTQLSARPRFSARAALQGKPMLPGVTGPNGLLGHARHTIAPPGTGGVSMTSPAHKIAGIVVNHVSEIDNNPSGLVREKEGAGFLPGLGAAFGRGMTTAGRSSLNALRATPNLLSQGARATPGFLGRQARFAASVPEGEAFAPTLRQGLRNATNMAVRPRYPMLDRPVGVTSMPRRFDWQRSALGTLGRSGSIAAGGISGAALGHSLLRAYPDYVGRELALRAGQTDPEQITSAQQRAREAAPGIYGEIAHQMLGGSPGRTPETPTSMATPRHLAQAPAVRVNQGADAPLTRYMGSVARDVAVPLVRHDLYNARRSKPWLLGATDFARSLTPAGALATMGLRRFGSETPPDIAGALERHAPRYALDRARDPSHAATGPWADALHHIIPDTSAGGVRPSFGHNLYHAGLDLGTARPIGGYANDIGTPISPTFGQLNEWAPRLSRGVDAARGLLRRTRGIPVAYEKGGSAGMKQADAGSVARSTLGGLHTAGRYGMETLNRAGNALRGAAYAAGGAIGTGASGLGYQLPAEVGYHLGAVTPQTREHARGLTNSLGSGMGAGVADVLKAFTPAGNYGPNSAITRMNRRNYEQFARTPASSTILGMSPNAQSWVTSGADLTANLASNLAGGGAATRGVTGAARVAGSLPGVSRVLPYGRYLPGGSQVADVAGNFAHFADTMGLPVAQGLRQGLPSLGRTAAGWGGQRAYYTARDALAEGADAQMNSAGMGR